MKTLTIVIISAVIIATNVMVGVYIFTDKDSEKVDSDGDFTKNDCDSFE